MTTLRSVLLALTCLTATTHADAPPPEKKSKLGDTTVLESKSSGLTEQTKVTSFETKFNHPPRPEGHKRELLQIRSFNNSVTSAVTNTQSSTALMRAAVPSDWFEVIQEVSDGMPIPGVYQLTATVTRLQCDLVEKQSFFSGIFENALRVNGQPVVLTNASTIVRIQCDLSLELGKPREIIPGRTVTISAAKALSSVSVTDTLRNLGLTGGQYKVAASATKKTGLGSKLPTGGVRSLQMSADDEARVLRYVLGDAVGKLLQDYQRQAEADRKSPPGGKE